MKNNKITVELTEEQLKMISFALDSASNTLIKGSKEIRPMRVLSTKLYNMTNTNGAINIRFQEVTK